jgi:DNA repair protein RecN (Recombination protein N)
VDALAALAQRYAADVALIDAGAGQPGFLACQPLQRPSGGGDAAAQKLSAARNKSADKLNKAVNSRTRAAQARSRKILHAD